MQTDQIWFIFIHSLSSDGNVQKEGREWTGASASFCLSICLCSLFGRSKTEMQEAANRKPVERREETTVSAEITTEKRAGNRNETGERPHEKKRTAGGQRLSDALEDRQRVTSLSTHLDGARNHRQREGGRQRTRTCKDLPGCLPVLSCSPSLQNVRPSVCLSLIGSKSFRYPR